METSGFDSGQTPEHINQADEGLSDQSFSLSPREMDAEEFEILKEHMRGIGHFVAVSEGLYKFVLDEDDDSDEIDFNKEDEIDSEPDEDEEWYEEMYDLMPEEMELLMLDPDEGGISMPDSWYE